MREFIPGFAASFDDLAVAVIASVTQATITQLLPDPLSGIQLMRPCRPRQQNYICELRQLRHGVASKAGPGSVLRAAAGELA